MRPWLIAVLALGCGGCGVDRDLDDQITIQQGVYGLLLSKDRPEAHQVVIVFEAGDAGIHARATSATDGVYQIDLAAADYTLCIETCTSVTVPDHDTVRYDWTSGPGGGTWSN